MMAAVSFYVGCMIILAIGIAIFLFSKNPPRWLLDKDPHDKYDEPN